MIDRWKAELSDRSQIENAGILTSGASRIVIAKAERCLQFVSDRQDQLTEQRQIARARKLRWCRAEIVEATGADQGRQGLSPGFVVQHRADYPARRPRGAARQPGFKVHIAVACRAAASNCRQRRQVQIGAERGFVFGAPRGSDGQIGGIA